MTAALLLLLGLANLLVLSAVVLLLRRLLRSLEGIEAAVWHVGDELRGGVGLRLGKSRTARPESRSRPPTSITDVG